MVIQEKTFLPLQDDKVYFDGQHIGIVIAETYEQARLAASLIEITYETEEPIFDLEQALEHSEKYEPGERLQPSRGRYCQWTQTSISHY